jgi:alginate O-acetyltransferase complex protein AlgI
MLFNSFTFIALLSITFLLYYFPKLVKYQIQILILASLIFYAYNRPLLVLLLLFSAAINITTSYFIVYGRFRKTYALIGVVLNLSILIFFKYSPLFSNTFFNKSSSIGQFLITIPLPVGISFFTFQGISLVVDVFKQNYFNPKELIPISFIEHSRRILFFKSFFPQLVSGPIVKAHDFLPQITTKKISEIKWDRCFKDIVLGYFFKMVIADNLKDFTFWIAYPYFQSQSTFTLLVMLFGYSCQIFSDFAGYSLIAIGIARLFGYNFKDNFNFPYISTSFREFWNRWHISLSSFLREYLYIPLGGNKKGKFRTYFNLMTTMILGGFWHGAAWSYAVWGIFHGAALTIERIIADRFAIKENRFFVIFKGFLVFLFVTLAWLLFKLPDFNHVIQYIKAIFTNHGVNNIQVITYILIYSLPVILYHAAYLVFQDKGKQKFKRLEYLAYGFMVFMIITNSGTSAAFIYFQF